MNNEYRPYTLIAELTYRCPLHCLYCSNPSDLAEHGNEIDADTWIQVFREAEELGVVQLNLTGGEPLLRDDLELLIEGPASSTSIPTLSRAEFHSHPNGFPDFAHWD